MAEMTDDFIEVDDVVTSPRGRSKVLNEDLLATLKRLPKGKVARLGGTFGNVAKEQRPTVAGIIRKHWSEVREGKPRVDFSPDGIAQVRER